jgi:hypothetical protein
MLLLGVYSDNESVATSRRSMSRESSVVDMVVTIPPVFAQPPETLEIRKGKSFYIEVCVCAQSKPNVKWIKNGKQIKESKRLKLTSSEEIGHKFKYRMEVDCASTEDDGSYEIIAENEDGFASTTVTVYSNEKKRKPSFTKTFSDIVVDEGNELTLSVKFEGYPKPQINWFKNGKTIKSSKTITQTQEKDECVLYIKSVSKSNHSGNYKCVAINPIGKCEHSAEVTVVKKDLRFIEKLHDLEVEENSHSLLVVKISSEDEDVRWHKDGEEIDRNDTNFEFIKEGYYRKLLIRKTHIENHGEYTCLLGTDQECSADLVVIELPPEITLKLKDKTCVVNETVSFNIELTKGDAIVKWFKNDEEIEFDDRIELRIDGKQQELVIKEVTLEDDAIYSCKLRDQISSAKLRVEPPTTEFTLRLPKNISADEDSEAILDVELSHFDVPVKWFKNGTQINESDNFKFISENTRHKLVIKKVKQSDSAEYSCVANGDQTKTKLQVNEDSAEFTLKLRDIIIKEGETATLSAEVSKVTHKVEWFKDEQQIISSDRITIIEEGIHRKLILKECTLEDRGMYLAVCKDKRTMAKVTIESAPRVTVDKRSYTAKRGENFVLEIPFEGHLPPKVEWNFNGKTLKTSKKIAIEALMSKTLLTIKKFDESDVGTYKLKLKNNIGECSVEFNISLIDRPDSPSSPQASDITNNSLILSWNAPKSDGGSQITNYIIEYHDKKTTVWKEYNEKFIIKETNEKGIQLSKILSFYLFLIFQ